MVWHKNRSNRPEHTPGRNIPGVKARDVNNDLTPKDQDKDKDLTPRTRTRTRT